MKDEISKKSKGFIQGVLLFGIALMAVVIAAFALSGKDSKKSTSNEAAKADAAALLSQGTTLASAIERMLSDRPLVTYNFGKDMFSENFGSPTIGLYNTQDSYAVPQVLPATTFANNTPINYPIIGQNSRPDPTAPSSKAGSWRLNSTAVVDGSTAHIIYVENIKDLVCNRINLTLYNNKSFLGVALSSSNLEGENVAINSTNVSNGGGSYTEGCVKMSDAKYYYFKVVYRP